MTPAIFGIAGPQLSDAERSFFRDADPAGYILFLRNCESRDQLRALTDDLRSIHGRDELYITIDQEGGRVTRMKPPVWDAYPAWGVFDTLYDLAPASAIEAARANAELIGLDLAECGVTSDALPLLDVRQPGANDIIGDRALGADPQRVAALGRAVLDGLARAGVGGIIKHMPGHGRALCDSHKDLPRVSAGAEELETDIAPFKALSDSPVAMTCHLLFQAWDADNPSTQSPYVIKEIIRKKIGFDGLLMTDDLDMEALDGSVPDRAEKSIAAGCDIALNCWAKMDDMEGIAERLPNMSAKVTERLDRANAVAETAANHDGRGDLLAKRDGLLDLVRQSA